VCPCGLGDGYESCCGRLHAGAPAPTAESLMRSRYSAFAVGDAGYLLRTWHPSGRPQNLSLDSPSGGPASRSWKRATAGSSTPSAQCSSVLRTSSKASVASSPRQASSSGKTDSGPTLVALTEGSLPYCAITLKGAKLDQPENRSRSIDSVRRINLLYGCFHGARTARSALMRPGRVRGLAMSGGRAVACSRCDEPPV
jgi:hypothetical protein